MRPLTVSRLHPPIASRGPRAALLAGPLAVLLAACGAAPAAEEDTRTAEEILIDSMRAMAEVESFRMDLRVDGTLSIPELGGGTIGLDGTTISGAFDVARERGTLTMEMPTFLGMHGEFRLIESDMYIQMSLSGDAWYHVEIPGSELPVAPDAEQAARDAAAFVQREGVELERLDDVSCASLRTEAAGGSPEADADGEADCHQLELVIPSEVVAEQPGAPPEADELFGDDLSVVLLVERDGSRWRGARFRSDIGEDGHIEAVLSLDGYGDGVSVEPPPEDQVQEGGGPFFPLPSTEPSA